MQMSPEVMRPMDKQGSTDSADGNYSQSSEANSEYAETSSNSCFHQRPD